MYDNLKQVILAAHEKAKAEIMDKLMKATTITGRPFGYEV